jgi:hypothetical protein
MVAGASHGWQTVRLPAFGLTIGIPSWLAAMPQFSDGEHAAFRSPSPSPADFEAVDVYRHWGRRSGDEAAAWQAALDTIAAASQWQQVVASERKYWMIENCAGYWGTFRYTASQTGAVVGGALWVGQSGNDRLAVCYRCSLERERLLGAIFNGLLSSLTFSVSAASAPAPVAVAHEQSMGRRWSGGGIAIAVSFIMAVVSLFMPWYDAVVISRNGLSQLGALLILAYIYPLWKAFEGGEINMGWGAWLGAIAIGGTGWYIYHQRVNFFGTTVNFASTGAYVFLVASIVLTIGILAYEPSQ